MVTTHQLAHASFTIYQDVERPEFWTNYFGVEPDMQSVRGQFRTTPSGRTSKYPARIGVWGVHSKGHVQSNILAPHLRYLVERLALPRSDLPELLKRTGAHMRFFCYWDNESGDRVPDVPDDIRTMMEAMGGTVEIDEYR
ncbi:DUF4279 domain-containing protein [Paraburkholderia sprentiae WSM5005]|uniref:DUF4279 domain-containing protein n=1 Tax=Paraburkholderia sprentiae WSM5005 TaxID=754502 RepID=A0A1I9YDN5_9BURK|nr:DUF4279 domain-containing protein [Paraburkholderia sprentiae]APA84418.1 DUF4279 domain-containing protein [Paraburkholderia sprentiae WSM5005]